MISNSAHLPSAHNLLPAFLIPNIQQDVIAVYKGNIIELALAILQRTISPECLPSLATSKKAVPSLTSLFQLLPKLSCLSIGSCVRSKAIKFQNFKGFLKLKYNPIFFLNEETELQRCKGHRTQSCDHIHDHIHLFRIIPRPGLSFSPPTCVKSNANLTDL